MRTGNTELDVYIWIRVSTQMLLDHIKCNFDRLKLTIKRNMVRVFLEMLLPFSRTYTYPAESLITLGAFDLGASTVWVQRDSNSTLHIWTSLCAVLHKDFIQSLLHKRVLLLDFGHLIRKFSHQINPINWTSFERVNMFLTVETKKILTMSASSHILVLFDFS